MLIPDGPVLVVEGYEYGIQLRRRDSDSAVWRMASTNHFDGWYPSEKSAKNALAQLRAVRWGREPFYEYRPVKRPVGEIEVLNG